VEREPNIVVFACNWCSYAGADLAGVSRIQYPPTVRLIRVMCSGRFDPDFALRAFAKGADGVLVMGCHPGDCHYVEGNLKAEVKVGMTAKLLDAVGIDPERFRLEWVSAGEGSRFAGIVKEFTDTLKKLGPSPLLATPKARKASVAESEQAETGGS
jgi:F420-non-reducing hydrogenase iron-sulfur subunit